MKKITLLAALLCGCTLFAQNDDDEVHFADEADFEMAHHEVKAGISLAVDQPAVEIGYEYLYSTSFTFGTNALMGFDGEGPVKEKFSVMPFARFYLDLNSYEGADGIYAEAFAKIFTGSEERYFNETFEIGTVNYTATALGVGVGEKYVFDSFFIDSVAGVGYMFGSSNNLDNLMLKFNFMLGYRF